LERDPNGRFTAAPPPERSALAGAIAACQAARARLARLRRTFSAAEGQSFDLYEAIDAKERELAEAERRAPQSRLAILLGDIQPIADPLPALRDELAALVAQRDALREDMAVLRVGIAGDPAKNDPGAEGRVHTAEINLQSAIVAEAVGSPEGRELVAELLAVTVRLRWLVAEAGVIGIPDLAQHHGIWVSVVDQRVRGMASALGDSLPPPPPSEWAPALEKMRTEPDTPLPKTRAEHGSG
jgi:hypothetical protein